MGIQATIYQWIHAGIRISTTSTNNLINSIDSIVPSASLAIRHHNAIKKCKVVKYCIELQTNSKTGDSIFSFNSDGGNSATITFSAAETGFKTIDLNVILDIGDKYGHRINLSGAGVGTIEGTAYLLFEDA